MVRGFGLKDAHQNCRAKTDFETVKWSVQQANHPDHEDGDFAGSAAQRLSTALPRRVVAPYDQRCTEWGISIMADVQVTLSLPVLRQGSNPESGPTVIEHLQLMLNERAAFRS